MPGYIKTRNIRGLSLRGIVVARPPYHTILSVAVPEIYDVVTGNALVSKRKMQRRLRKRAFLEIELVMVDVPHAASRGTVTVPVYVIHDCIPTSAKYDRRYQTRSVRESNRRMAKMLVQTVFSGDPDKGYISVDP